MLPYDLLAKFLNCQDPKGIRALYESSEELFKETIEHTNFTLDCKEILSDEEIEWFESKNIKVKLLEEYKIDKQGNQIWYKNGRRHREHDLPAEIETNGSQWWYKNGELHRDNDLPAVKFPNGFQEWYQNGKCHREHDLPAVIFSNGDQCWYQNGKYHRDNDLPAVIITNVTQRWYKNGINYTPS